MNKIASIFSKKFVKVMEFCGTKETTYNVWKFLKKLTIDLPHDPAISVLGMSPDNLKTLLHEDICTSVFTAAKTWN